MPVSSPDESNANPKRHRFEREYKTSGVLPPQSKTSAVQVPIEAYQNVPGRKPLSAAILAQAVLRAPIPLVRR